MIRTISLFFATLILVSCASQSVYEMSEEQQEGLTYEIYEEPPEEAFKSVLQVLSKDGSDDLTNGSWQIQSSNEQEGTIETSWRTTSNSGSVGGGAVGSESNERYKINVEISERDSGSLIYLTLERQLKMTGDPETEGQWQMFDVNRQAAKEYLQPIFSKLEKTGLNPQD